MQPRTIYLKTVDSTNSYLSRIDRDGKEMEELAVVADYQEFGRGQAKHRWISDRGKNLLISLRLFPAFLSASGLFHLTRVGSLAVHDLLHGLGITSMIKWPNDILTDQGKIAGILIENGVTGDRVSRTIIGIGLNLNQVVFPTFPVPATSLLKETGIKYRPREMAMRMVEAVMERYFQLQLGKTGELERDYLDRMYLLGIRTRFSAGSEEFNGTIRGVSDSGELMLERGGELTTFGFGEISYLEPN
jgi:BirA family biotin operon repressor/biotin-[acetyl-CoA-carboxylase] ligase